MKIDSHNLWILDQDCEKEKLQFSGTLVRNLGQKDEFEDEIKRGILLFPSALDDEFSQLNMSDGEIIADIETGIYYLLFNEYEIRNFQKLAGIDETNLAQLQEE